MFKIIFTFSIFLFSLGSKGNKPVYTQVTALYDINRGSLNINSAYRRAFSYYLDYFGKLLQSDSNMIIFGDKELGKFVWQRRKEHNTVFVERQLSAFRNTWYYPYIQKLRMKLLQDSSWLFKDTPPYALQFYIPIVMSKPFLLKQSLKHDKFNSDYFTWTDAGYLHVYNENIVFPENLIQKFYQFVQPQWMFITYNVVGQYIYGYSAGSERYINRSVPSDQTVSAASFGGYIEAVEDFASTYQNLLRTTFQYGDMNAQESVLSLMPYKYPYLIPNSIMIKFDELKNKMHLYQSVSRKSQHHRRYKISWNYKLNISQAQVVTVDRQEAKSPSQNINQQALNNIKVDKGDNFNESSHIKNIGASNSNENSLNEKFEAKRNFEIKDGISLYKRAIYRLLSQFILLLVIYIYMIVANIRAKKIIAEKLKTVNKQAHKIEERQLQSR